MTGQFVFSLEINSFIRYMFKLQMTEFNIIYRNYLIFKDVKCKSTFVKLYIW